MARGDGGSVTFVSTSRAFSRRPGSRDKAPALAEPLLFDPTMPDPRTAGELPPGQAAPAEPLKPSIEIPGGGLWLRGEVPSGAADPNHALRGARAEAGARLRLSRAPGSGGR